MLLRLRIQGFKNLRDVDIHFGPLTCFVGPNGVGKSNVFDAIQLLRHLADDEIQTAAGSIRQPTEGSFSPLDLITDRDPSTTMRFAADMLVPRRAVDDFGQECEPSATLLNYVVALRFDERQNRLVLAEERLVHHNKGDARDVLLFPNSRAFRESVVFAKRYGTAFISSQTDGDQARIQIHSDGGSRGRAVPAGPSPRTIVGGTTSNDYPTIIAARREMASWHAVHLEPSSLRAPDRFGEERPVDERGAHIAATLRRLGRERSSRDLDEGHVAEAGYDGLSSTCAEAANQLARLVHGVADLRVRDDEVRQHHVVEVRFHGSDVWMPPRALSEGTLRYLALVTMQMDQRSSHVLCIEEPENGIEPNGVPELIGLLRDYAVDPELPANGADNPLRQVILNSHSRDVVGSLPAGEVLFVESVRGPEGRSAQIRSVDYPDVWRPAPQKVSSDYFKQWIGGLPRGQMTFGA
ncbi:MAG: AAA family ATPase [Planctomycetes bacterium]|nr:AAA family ATPase [Planctomycetota bacterium]